jgi:hypothetical protein
MQPHTHLVASALLGLAVYPRSPKRAVIVALSGTLIDIDHYVLYALRSGDWNPIGALRYNRRRRYPIRPGDTRPRYGPLRSIVHHIPLTVPVIWLLAWAFPHLRPTATGVTLHLAMDFPWSMSFDWRVWRRAQGRCERCGRGDRRRDIYHVIIPKRGGDYWAPENRAAWCEQCAKAVRRDQGLA